MFFFCPVAISIVPLIYFLFRGYYIKKKNPVKVRLNTPTRHYYLFTERKEVPLCKEKRSNTIEPNLCFSYGGERGI